jgi:hypothetical protein
MARAFAMKKGQFLSLPARIKTGGNYGVRAAKVEL